MKNLTPIPPHPYSAFLRTVSGRKPVFAHGPDGGYLVPRHLYGHLLTESAMAQKEQGQDDAPPPPNTRVYAIAPLANSALLAGDEFAARALLTTLVGTLCLKVPSSILRTAPLEMEASAEATYKTHTGKLASAFANDETVFRLTVRVPAQDEGTRPLNTRLGRQVTR